MIFSSGIFQILSVFRIFIYIFVHLFNGRAKRFKNVEYFEVLKHFSLNVIYLLRLKAFLEVAYVLLLNEFGE